MRLATSLVALGLVGFSLATSEFQNPSPSCESVTETVTVTVCQSETALASVVNSASTASFSTITSFSTLTSYVTVAPSQTTSGPASSPVDVLPSSSGYYYIDHDGTTSWIGGVSPTASFSSFVTKTIQITVFPTSNDDPEVTITQTKVLTITPPAVTSVESHSSVALASQSDEGTTTSTITSYLTKSIISIQTVYLSSRSSTSAAFMTPSAVTSAELASHSIHTVTGPPTSTTVTVKEATTTESVCSVSYVDVTTDLTYTVLATPSASFSSAINSVGNLSSLASAASAWNSTLHPLMTLTGSLYKPFGFSGAATTLMGSLMSSVSAGAALQKTATAIAPVVPSSAFRDGNNGSTVSASATGYIPLMPVPIISLGAPAALSHTSSTLTKMYTNTSSSSMPAPTVCGEHGDFTLTWEDEPIFLPTEPITDPSDAPPVFNPYHHMYFSDGFVYAPPPSVPFVAVSSPRLVMFVANETGDNDNQSEGGQLSGEIGAGTRRSSDAFWFNAYSAYVGCENHSAHQCTLEITGLVYQNESKSEVAAFHQTVSLPPCHLPDNCHLTQVHFSQSMKGLSGLRLQASVNDEAISWFMDNLALGWSNNTCAAGLLRGRSR